MRARVHTSFVFVAWWVNCVAGGGSEQLLSIGLLVGLSACLSVCLFVARGAAHFAGLVVESGTVCIYICCNYAGMCELGGKRQECSGGQSSLRWAEPIQPDGRWLVSPFTPWSILVAQLICWIS